jgi:hypothetical protein
MKMGTPITKKSKIKNQPMRAQKKLPGSIVIHYFLYSRKKPRAPTWRSENVEPDLNSTTEIVP